MNKKAQGLSMNVIIIAAIALLVLVILSVLLLHTGGKLSLAGKCSSIEGSTCIDEGDACGTNFISALGKGCDVDGQKCCVPLGN